MNIRNKHFIICLSTALLTAPLTACNNAAVLQEQEQEQVSLIAFTDDLGNEFELESPQKVACTLGSFADIWVLAGGKDSLVAAPADTWTSFDLDLDESVVNLGEIKGLDSEALIASNPDLVLASAKNESNKELKELMDSVGIQIAYFDVSSFEDYLRMLKICTDLTGDQSAYEENGTAIQEQVNEAIAMADKSNPSVLYLRATGSGVKAMEKEGSVLGEMLTSLDCHNITEDSPSLLDELSLEAILEADPEYIFLVYQGSDPSDAKAAMESELLSNPAWQTLSAVQNNQVYVLEHELYNLKPNEKWGEAYLKLAEIIYGNASQENA